MIMQSSLSDQCRAMILGSLLGDGSLKIHTGYKNARFSFRHSLHQKQYFDWKVSMLKEISTEHCTWEQHDEGFSNEKLRYQSAALESLTALYRLTHDQGQFRIRRHWLNMLTPLSLAVWWCDDGSLIGNTRKGVICTDGFPQEEVELLARYLQVVWKIHTHVGAAGAQGRRASYYRVWIRSTEELQKFLRIILPNIPVSSMLPKVLLLYKDSQLQQRWISEVQKATHFSHEIIEHYRREKQAKWRQFRE